MTRYTELRHAGYYQHGLTNTERETIAAQADGTTVEYLGTGDLPPTSPETPTIPTNPTPKSPTKKKTASK